MAAQSIEIQPSGPIHGSIRPPGSKSITNRALVCAALAEGESLLSGALDSEDTRVMAEALRRLGIAVEHSADSSTLRVSGCAGRVPARGADLHVANSGTSMRFLAALVTLGKGTFRIDGSPRMRERPIEDLLAALRSLGADAASQSPGGCPPVVVRAAGLRGGRAAVAGSISSQFLSGLLMAAPYAQEDVEFVVDGELVSKPYVEMTMAVMREFGVAVKSDMPDARRRGDVMYGQRLLWPDDASDIQMDHALPFKRFHVPAGQRYRPRPYSIEPDASAASYFFAAAAITGGSVTVEGISQASIQGDVGFCGCLQRMGCEVSYGDNSITVARNPQAPLRGIEADMNAISDTVQTLGAVALFAQTATTITGVAHIRHKETDRIAALAAELRKLGAAVEEKRDGLTITPGLRHGAEIETYDDHRMAMSLAIAGLAIPGVKIRDPGCTAKTYPRFFEDLMSLTRSQ